MSRQSLEIFRNRAASTATNWLGTEIQLGTADPFQAFVSSYQDTINLVPGGFKPGHTIKVRWPIANSPLPDAKTKLTILETGETYRVTTAAVHPGSALGSEAVILAIRD